MSCQLVTSNVLRLGFASGLAAVTYQGFIQALHLFDVNPIFYMMHVVKRLLCCTACTAYAQAKESSKATCRLLDRHVAYR